MPATETSVTVSATINGQLPAFTFNAGSGRQTVRWLALAAAQRYSLKHRVGGRVRQRERDVSASAGSLTPVDVLHMGKSIPPSRKLRDLAVRGKLALDVLLATEVRVVNGAPSWHRDGSWRDSAFGHSKAAQERVRAHKVKAERSNKRTAVLRKTARSTLRRASFLTELDGPTPAANASLGGPAVVEEKSVIQFRRGTEDLAVTVGEDWPLVGRAVAQIAGHESAEVDLIRKLFLEHYRALRDAYKYYSGIGKEDSTHTMSFVELMHFLAEASVLRLSDERIVHNVVVDVLRQSMKQPGEADISRPEFMEILLRLACSKELMDLDAKRQQGGAAALGTPGRSPRSAAAAPPVSERFRAVIEDKVVPALNRRLGPVRDLLNDQEVIQILSDRTKALRGVFRHYRASDSDNGRRSDSTINLKEFTSMLRAAGYFEGQRDRRSSRTPSQRHAEEKEGSGGGKKALSLAEARAAFAASQIGNENDEEHADGMHEMTFKEFIESLVRCAIASYADSPELSNTQKVRMLVADVCVLHVAERTASQLSLLLAASK